MSGDDQLEEEVKVWWNKLRSLPAWSGSVVGKEWDHPWHTDDMKGWITEIYVTAVMNREFMITERLGKVMFKNLPFPGTSLEATD